MRMARVSIGSLPRPRLAPGSIGLVGSPQSGPAPVGSKLALALPSSVMSAAAPVGSKRAAVFRGGIRASEAAASVSFRLTLYSDHPLTPSFERRGTSLAKEGNQLNSPPL